jgi:hypothetical protein
VRSSAPPRSRGRNPPPHAKKGMMRHGLWHAQASGGRVHMRFVRVPHAFQLGMAAATGHSRDSSTLNWHPRHSLTATLAHSNTRQLPHTRRLAHTWLGEEDFDALHHLTVHHACRPVCGGMSRTQRAHVTDSPATTSLAHAAHTCALGASTCAAGHTCHSAQWDAVCAKT